MSIKNIAIGFGGIITFAAAIAKEFWGWPTVLKVVIILVPLAFFATVAILAVTQHNRLMAAIKEHRKAGEIEL